MPPLRQDAICNRKPYMLKAFFTHDYLWFFDHIIKTLSTASQVLSFSEDEKHAHTNNYLHRS